ncbi:MAG TPA: FxsA family protein [Actinomycetales bacterium]
MVSRGRSRWTVVLLVALLVVPTLEIAVIVTVGREIGVLPTLVLLVAESALGAWLVRREGARAWRALSQALTSRRMPAGELSDAALVLVGGTLLLTPGFLTDVAGFFFVLPFTRPLARRLLTRVVERQLLGSVVRGPFGGTGPAGSAGGMGATRPPVVPG